jgi:hypothetical protein
MERPARVARVSAEQVRMWMDEGEELTILDSRSAAAWGTAPTKAAGAIRVPPHDAASHLEEIPRGTRIVAYCT